jgi:hypothetical protein
VPLHKPVLPMSLQPKAQDALALPQQIIKPLPIHNSIQLPSTRSEP